MTKTTYTVPQVPGSSRTSERPYTHAVIGRRDGRISAITYAADLADTDHKTRKCDGKHWDDCKRESEAVVGQLYRNHNGYMVEARDYIVESGKKFITENPDRQAYIDSKAAERQAYLQSLQNSQPGDVQVLQWSMSWTNAMKSVTTYRRHHSDVHVVECQPVPKSTTKKATA